MGDAAIDDPIEHVAFEFSITNQERDATLKNKPPLKLPIFYGLVIEDLETFFFEFYVLCWSYDYITNVH